MMSFLDINDRFPGEISRVSWRYLIGVLEIFIRCPGVFEGCPGDI